MSSHLIYTVRPCLIHTCHAALQPCSSSQGHGTELPSKDGLWDIDQLWATYLLSASCGYHGEFQESYQTQTNLRCRWPVWNQTTFVMDEGKLNILVQGHECLYNLRHKDYDNNLVKDNCRKEIAGEVHARGKNRPHNICWLHKSLLLVCVCVILLR